MNFIFLEIRMAKWCSVSIDDVDFGYGVFGYGRVFNFL